jgi:hypothetical protein
MGSVDLQTISHVLFGKHRMPEGQQYFMSSHGEYAVGQTIRVMLGSVLVGFILVELTGLSHTSSPAALKAHFSADRQQTSPQTTVLHWATPVQVYPMGQQPRTPLYMPQTLFASPISPMLVS